MSVCTCVCSSGVCVRLYGVMPMAFHNYFMINITFAHTQNKQHKTHIIYRS